MSYVSLKSQSSGTPLDSALVDAAEARGEPWQTAKRAAAILGYEWVAGKGLFGEMTVVLLPLAGGSRHQEETSRLRSTMESDHPAALNALRSAYDAYQRGGIDGNRQACEASRNAVENVVRDLTGMDLGPGLDKLAGDNDRRIRFFKSFRDALSVWGTHAKEQPAERDTLLALRVTEELIVWLLKTSGNW